MRRLCLVFSIVSMALMYLIWPQSVQAASPAVGMRPYTGIGVLMLGIAADTAEPNEQLRLYDEPAIYRQGELEIARIPRHEWIFGPNADSVPLIVTARKREWLRVVYDDAGREAWINPGPRGVYQPWDDFFKGRAGRLLPGLQKRHYQLFSQAGRGPQATLTPKQFFKVIMFENDWSAVLTDSSTLGWLRWRDEDGRLLIALDAGKTVQAQQR